MSNTKPSEFFPKEVLKFFILGILYSFILKNFISSSFGSRDIFYVMANPSLDQELWFFVPISYYLLVRFISEEMVSEFHSFIYSFKILESLKNKVLLISSNKKNIVRKVILFLLSAILFLCVFALFGLLINDKNEPLIPFLFFIYLNVLALLTVVKIKIL